MKKNKCLIKKLNVFILSNGSTYKMPGLLKFYFLKLKINPFKQYLKLKVPTEDLD
jgi:hypothetical protein